MPKVILIILPKIISLSSGMISIEGFFYQQDGMPVAAVTKSFDGCYQW